MAKTYLVGLIGEGIENSLTPDLHMREARELGLDYEFRLIDLLDSKFDGASFQDIFELVSNAGYDAINVTFPFKKFAIDFAESKSDDVKHIGALNLMLNLQEQPHAENTDWSGFKYAIENGIADVPRRKVLQVGAGGAGVATAFAMLKSGVQQLLIADLQFEKAIALATQYRDVFPQQKIKACPIEEAMDYLAAIDGVIQATPIGMYTHPGMPFEIETLNPAAWVADVVYRPMETQFIQQARARGHEVMTGGLMAIGQAIDSLRLITGLEPNPRRMRDHFYELLEDESALTKARGI